MKNSPDRDWLSNLEKRLRDYTEEPDADLWDKIAGKKPNRIPAWIFWVNRSAALITISTCFWLWFQHQQNDLVIASKKNETFDSAEHRADSLLFTWLSERQSQSVLHSKENVSLSNSMSSLEGDNTNRSKYVLKNNKLVAGGNTSMSQLVEHDTSLNEALGKAQTIVNYENKIDVEGSVASTLVSKDSLVNPLLLTQEKKSKRKPNHFRFYLSVTPQLAYQKITPYKNDGIVIKGLNPKSIFAGDRLGLNLEAGIQGRLSKRLEFYSGFSVYQQSQQLSYQYQMEDDVNMHEKANVTQAKEFDYTIAPKYTDGHIEYKMLNIGGQAGLLYYLSGEVLKHKFGAGLSYQHGLRKARENDSHDNAQSKYLFYNIYYRNEFKLRSKSSIFIQPGYTHAILSKEKLDAPFKIRPYRVGLTFGVVHNF